MTEVLADGDGVVLGALLRGLDGGTWPKNVSDQVEQVLPRDGGKRSVSHTLRSAVGRAYESNWIMAAAPDRTSAGSAEAQSPSTMRSTASQVTGFLL